MTMYLNLNEFCLIRFRLIVWDSVLILRVRISFRFGFAKYIVSGLLVIENYFADVAVGYSPLRVTVI